MTWTYIGSSVRGTSHQRTGVPCQDSHSVACRQYPHGPVLWIVVADGAGSASMGGTGANIVTTSLAGRIERYLDAFAGDLTAISADMVHKWVERTRHRLLDAACMSNLSARDFACTLLGTVIGPDQAIFFQIGDGAIVFESTLPTASSSYEVAFWPVEAEYANLTSFITQSDFADHLLFHRVDYSPSHVAVFTDGLQRLCLEYASQRVHEPFFAPMFARLQRMQPGYSLPLADALTSFLDSQPVNARTDDDKSLVLAVRNPTLLTETAEPSDEDSL